MILRILLLSFFLSSCRHDQNPTPIKRDPQQIIFDIKTRWKAQSYSCGEMSLNSDSFNEYKFDNNHFIRIESQETNEEKCILAYVFERIIAGSIQADSSYEEQGILRGSKAKRKCSKISSVSATSAEDVISFGPEEVAYSLSTEKNLITIVIHNAPNCRTGDFKLELIKMSQ